MSYVPTLELVFKIDGAFQFRDFHSNHGEPVSRAVSQLDQSLVQHTDSLLSPMWILNFMQRVKVISKF